MERDFLIVICERKHLVKVAEIIAQSVKFWNDRPWGDLHLLFIEANPQKIKRIGCSLIGLRHSFPGLRVEIIDKKGII